MATVILNNGVVMPQIGFGTALLSDDEAYRALSGAFADGYRKVDTASAYSNEIGIGRAIATSGLSRSEVFITTKAWNTEQGRANTRAAFERSLERLGLDHVDLYLIHWPAPMLGLFSETWEVLEELAAEGLTRAIGVSNFRREDLEVLTSSASRRPAVNQVQLHPYLQRRELRTLHRDSGIITEAWAPLSQGALLGDPTLADIASRNGMTTAQVVLRWHLQYGHSVIPRSQDSTRRKANLATGTLPLLSTGDMRAIDALNRHEVLDPDPATFN